MNRYDLIAKKAGYFKYHHSDLMFYDKDLKLIAEHGEFEIMIRSNSRDVKAVSFEK